MPDGSKKTVNWNGWKSFNEAVDHVFPTGTEGTDLIMEYKEVPMLINAYERRRLRSHNNDAVTPLDIKKKSFERITIFLNDIVSQLERYFLPWPQWLELSESLFLFTPTSFEPEDREERLEFRLRQLEELFVLPHSHSPLTDDDKTLLRAQYTTLCITADEIAEEIYADGKLTLCKHINNCIWYTICSKENHFRGLQAIIDYAMRFLIRDFNECSVESLIGDVEFVKGGKGSRRTRLHYETLHEQMFIRKNGPHPLLSVQLRKEALDRVFEKTKKWKFIISHNFSNMPSKVFASRLQNAKLADNCCFE